MEIMAKPEIWVGLDTDATAGGNGNVNDEWSSNCDVAFGVHDCVRALYQEILGNRKLEIGNIRKGSLTGKAVVLKTTGSLPCRFESCPFRQKKTGSSRQRQ
jgi:hypothetical protein